MPCSDHVTRSSIDAITDNDFAARWSKMNSIVVEHSMDLDVGGDLGVNSGRMEKIEGQNGLVKEEVLTVLGKVGIGATADDNKVRLEGLDCLFGFVQMVVARGLTRRFQ